MSKKNEQSNSNDAAIAKIVDVAMELERSKEQLKKLGFSNESIDREQLKIFAEQVLNSIAMTKIMELADKDPDSFLKHYFSLTKMIYPVQKAEDSRQKALSITIMNGDSPKTVDTNSILPNPSKFDLPPAFNFDKIESPLGD